MRININKFVLKKLKTSSNKPINNSLFKPQRVRVACKRQQKEITSSALLGGIRLAFCTQVAQNGIKKNLIFYLFSFHFASYHLRILFLVSKLKYE